MWVPCTNSGTSKVFSFIHYKCSGAQFNLIPFFFSYRNNQFYFIYSSILLISTMFLLIHLCSAKIWLFFSLNHKFLCLFLWRHFQPLGPQSYPYWQAEGYGQSWEGCVTYRSTVTALVLLPSLLGDNGSTTTSRAIHLCTRPAEKSGFLLGWSNLNINTSFWNSPRQL